MLKKIIVKRPYIITYTLKGKIISYSYNLELEKQQIRLLYRNNHIIIPLIKPKL